MSETVELFGGPRHGERRILPVTSSTALEVEATFTVDGKLYKRRGRYTRVHDINQKSLPFFEFSGYTTALIPMETEA